MRKVTRLNLLFASAGLFGLAFVSLPCGAYEVPTHVKMSLEATRQSNLDAYLPDIGLKTLRDPLTDINVVYSIENWIGLGADHEDDLFTLNPARYRNHFYGPLTGLGLNALASGEPSPDWGLEDTKTFTTQSYSFGDARQFFYDALTLTDKDKREKFMARTFYTLGHVIHLIQDMAQPKHTRNDSHGGGIFGPPSRYEIYTQGALLPFTDANYNKDKPVMFNTPRQFWTGAGQGIADFTNRNFVSAGTNFDTDRYTYPRLADAVPHDENANDLLRSVGLTPSSGCEPTPCTMTFYRTAVNDAYRPGARGVNERTSI